MRIFIPHLKESAKNRPSGYYDDCISRGKVNGDYLLLDKKNYIELLKKYNKRIVIPKARKMPISGSLGNIPIHHSPHIRTQPRFIGNQTGSMPMRGLGDFVARIANPIAGAIDKVFHTHIQGCGGCAERQKKLNKAIPF